MSYRKHVVLWDFILALWWRPALERRPTCKFPTFKFLNFPYTFRTYYLPAPQSCQSAQTLHYITLHYIILLYITMVYCNLHCMYVCMCVCMYVCIYVCISGRTFTQVVNGSGMESPSGCPLFLLFLPRWPPSGRLPLGFSFKDA